MKSDPALASRVALATAVVLGLGAGCTRDSRSADRTAIDACDYSQACARAVAAVRARPADSPAAALDRLGAFHAMLNAAAAFPGARTEFLAAAGWTGPGWRDAMAADAEALRPLPAPKQEIADAIDVAEFLRAPSCDRLDRLAQVARRPGPFADTAAMARMSALGELLTSVEPDRVHLLVVAARGLAGCGLSDQAASAAVLVAARDLFYEAVDACPQSPADKVVAASCTGALEVARTRTLPLPFVEAASGEVQGAWLPAATRGIGLSFTPPWILVLAAGRLSVVDQVVLAPGDRQVRDPEPEPLLDLRARHRPEDLGAALLPVFNARKPYAGMTEPVVAIVIDRNETVLDIIEVLEGILARTDAIPVIAVLPPGSRSAVFYPLNYREPRRVLMDPDGVRRPFSGSGTAVALELSPASAVLRSSGGERSFELPRAAPGSKRGLDLRELYGAGLEFGGPSSGPWPTLLVTADPTVSLATLFAVTERLAVRVQPAALATPDAFDAAAPMRTRGGAYDYLLPVAVLLLND